MTIRMGERNYSLPPSKLGLVKLHPLSNNQEGWRVPLNWWQCPDQLGYICSRMVFVDEDKEGCITTLI
jgi:hypothetical protein